MWKQLASFVKQMLLLTEESKHHASDITKLQEQMRDLTLALEQLRYEIRRVSDRDESEREKMTLRLEAQLLRFERRLTSGDGRGE